MSRRNSRTALDLLGQLAEILGGHAQLIHADEREWASITFTGARHRFVFELPESAMTSPALSRALAVLPEHEFILRGEIVADCTATLGLPYPSDLTPGHAAPGNHHDPVRLLVIELLTVIGV